jgi:DNA-binding transcriptional LysR family regulator
VTTPTLGRVDLHQLRCFVAVAEERHFGRAARRLHLTASPVSRTVRDLERELAGDLFLREHREVQLTDLGRAMLPQARQLLADAARLVSSARRLCSGAGDVLTLAATHVAPPQVLDQAIAFAQQVLPGSTVTVTTTAQEDLLMVLESGATDVVLGYVPLERPGIETIVITRFRFHLLMRADDPLAGRARLALTELTERLVSVLPDPALVLDLRSRLHEAGVHDQQELADFDTMRIVSHIQHTHGIVLALHPDAGGPARVFADPAFAVVPLVDDLWLPLSIAWREDTPDWHDGVRLLGKALRERPVLV